MASFTQGQVTLAFLVFSGGQGSKRRPVLVLQDFGDADVLVVPITSHPPRSKSDVSLTHWKDAGLRLPSTARMEKFSTIAKSCVAQTLGSLSGGDLGRIRQTLADIFQKISG